jgi:ATP-dependent Clp protease adaptor protein ClpS
MNRASESGDGVFAAGAPVCVDPPSEQPGQQPQNEPAKSGGEPVPQAPAGNTAAAVKERPAPPKTEHLPPFKVLLHNDDQNEALYVVRTIMELTPLQKERAMTAMLEAHTSGVSLLLVTHKERAELYQEQFQTKQLVVTIEPA